MDKNLLKNIQVFKILFNKPKIFKKFSMDETLLTTHAAKRNVSKNGKNLIFTIII